MDNREDIHNGCPYRCTCEKDLSKCCYLVGNKCIAYSYSDEYYQTTYEDWGTKE